MAVPRLGVGPQIETVERSTRALEPGNMEPGDGIFDWVEGEGDIPIRVFVQGVGFVGGGELLEPRVRLLGRCWGKRASAHQES